MVGVVIGVGVVLLFMIVAATTKLPFMVFIAYTVTTNQLCLLILPLRISIQFLSRNSSNHISIPRRPSHKLPTFT